MVEKNMITNCDINADDIKRADTIWGPAESVLQGKMKRKQNTHNKIPNMSLHLSVSQQHKQITMYIEFFLCQSNPFFIIKDRETKFIVWNKTKIKERKRNNKCD